MILQTLQPYWLDDPEETAALGIFELQLRDCKDFNHTIARTFKLKNTKKIVSINIPTIWKSWGGSEKTRRFEQYALIVFWSPVVDQ